MACEPWPVLWSCEDPPTVEPAQLLAATEAARSLLWHLSGARFGTCEVTERYRPAGGGSCGVPYKDFRTGLWHNGGTGGNCCSIHLRSRPAQRVVSVELHGSLMGPGEYRLEGAGNLVRVGACWPAVGECDDPPIRVTYTWGVALRPPVYDESDPPVVIKAPSPYWGAAGLAMGELVREFVDGMCGEPCKLPSRIASITRQGVTVNFVSPEEWFALGLVGMPLTDSFIRSVNPKGRRAPSRVYSPDMARRV